MSMSRLGWDNQRGRVPATFDASGRGGGYVVPIIPRTDYSFDGRTGQQQYVPVAVGVDASSWVSGVLLARMHAKGGTWGAGSKVQVIVDNIMIVPEEPDVIFATSPTLASPVATLEFTEGEVAPLLKVSAFSAPIGSMLRVHVRWVQATAAVGPQTVSLGIDLVGRPA